MSGNWLHNIKHVTPGEPVQAGVVNRPDRTLEERTEYLKDRLDASAVGQAIFDHNATIATDVLPGHPVFWNYTTHRYEKALAAIEVDQTTSMFVVLPSSDCVGMCLRKRSATLGDIVLHGIVDMPDLANAIATPITPGRYYLSAVEPGKLTKQRPAITVSVCHVQGPKDTCSDVPRVVVMPATRDFLEEHIHYRFDLYARPASATTTLVAPGGTHIVQVPSVALQGWLPASDPSFNGKAPAGAVFGYNMTTHTALANVWPPLPVQSVAMLWDKGIALVGATEIPLGSNGLAVCDVNGIWWMSNCYGDAPWPATYSSSVVVESTNAVPPECPREEAMRIVVVYLRMLIGNDRSMVTSLKPGVDSPVVITNCDGIPATIDHPMTGDLDLNLNLQLEAGESVGGQAIKAIVHDGRRLKKGWIAEGAFTLSEHLTIKGSRDEPRYLTSAELDALGYLPAPNAARTLAASKPLQQGVLQIDYTDTLVEREISPQIIRLSDTVERLYMDIPYIGLPTGQESLLRVRLNVPSANLGSGLKMKVRVQLFSRGGTDAVEATVSPLYMTRRILPMPATLTGRQELITTDASVIFWPSAGLELLIDTAAQIESEEFVVDLGDTVLVTIGRIVGNSAMPEVGILRITGVVRASA